MSLTKLKKKTKDLVEKKNKSREKKNILMSVLPIRSQRQSIAAIIKSFRKTSAGDYKQIIKFKGGLKLLNTREKVWQ